MQQKLQKTAMAGIAGLFLFTAAGCYKCYTAGAGCSDAFKKAVEDNINNNPYIVDYQNRRILCEAASNSPPINSTYTNAVGCTVTWQLSTN